MPHEAACAERSPGLQPGILSKHAALKGGATPPRDELEVGPVYSRRWHRGHKKIEGATVGTERKYRPTIRALDLLPWCWAVNEPEALLEICAKADR